MIVFMLLGIFAVLGICLGIVAYSSGQRRRSGMAGTTGQDPGAIDDARPSTFSN